MNILKAFFGTPQYVSRADTTSTSPDPDPYDIWLFTDPDARDKYAEQGQLKNLAHDIEYEVMRAGAWEPDELEYKNEIRRLLREGKIVDKGTYWFSSPFPTVYRAKRDGSLSIANNTYTFKQGDDIVFQCRMTRDMNKDLTAPLLISRLQATENSMLCSQMGGAMKGKM